MRVAKQIDARLEDGTFHRVLLLASQPGDIIRAAGELVQIAGSASADIRIVLMTQGLPRPWVQRVVTEGPKYQAMLKCQQHDAVQALMTLGVARYAIRFLDYTSGELSDGLLTYRANLLDAVAAELEAFRPTLVVTPSRCDRDADNSAIGLITALALGQAKTLSAVHLAYVVHGPAPAIPLSSKLEIPSDQRRLALKSRALQAVRLQQGREGNQIDRADQSEVFIEAETNANYGTLFCAMQNACKTHIAVKPQRGSEQRLWVYPAVMHMHPARIVIENTGTLQLGSRQSDVMQLEKDDSGISLEIGSYVDPLWVKLDSTNSSDNLDVAGWHRVLPVLRSANHRLVCIMPCYNVADSILPLLQQASNYVDCIVAVDDGSTDDTLTILESAAHDRPFLQVLSHRENRGKGHALLAGMRHALATTDCTLLVTMHADGQHNPDNIPALAETQRTSEAVMTIGVGQHPASMPFRQRVRNFLVSALTRIKYRRLPSDIGSGFRLLTRDFAIEILEQVPASRYTTEIEILTRALRRYQVSSTYLDSPGGRKRTRPDSGIQSANSLRTLASFIRCCMNNRRTA